MNEKTQKLVARCRGALISSVPKWMDVLKTRAEAALYDLADKAESNNRFYAYIEAVRRIREDWWHVESRFQTGVSHRYDRYWGKAILGQDTGQIPERKSKPLALVTQPELEESLALSNLVSKVESRFHTELRLLDYYFSALRDQSGRRGGESPFSPRSLCGALRDALQGLDVEILVILLIYKMFDRYVLSLFGDLYVQICTVIEASGLVEKPALAAFAEASAGASTVPERVTGHPPGPAAPGGTGRREKEGAEPVFQQLRQLLHATPNPHQVGPAPPGRLEVRHEELLDALAVVQRDLVQSQAGCMAPADLRQRLRRQLGLAPGLPVNRTLGAVDEDTLEIVVLLFERILQDPRLPDPIKVEIARLQIPVLRVAVLDKEFFDNAQHPARQFLNNLATATIGWDEEDTKTTAQSVGAKVRSLVERALYAEASDAGLFLELNGELSDFLQREAQNARRVEAKVQQVERGKERLKVARRIVDRRMAEGLRQSGGVPREVRELLQTAWRDVLLLAYLRDGPESVTWRSGLAVMDRLLWSVTPKRTYEERNQLLRSIPELLRKLKDGLGTISYDQRKVSQLFGRLQTLHMACLQGAVAPVDPAKRISAEAAPVFPLESDPGPWEDAAGTSPRIGRPGARVDAGPAPAETAALIAAMSLHTWIGLSREDGSLTRCRLSWRSAGGQRLHFVNRRGLKVAELGAAELAQRLTQGKVQILDDFSGAAVVDLALESIRRQLRGRDFGNQHA